MIVLDGEVCGLIMRHTLPLNKEHSHVNHVSPRVRVFIIALCSVVTLTASFTSSAQAICIESDFTFEGQQPFFVCQTGCVASVRNSLSCNVFRQNRICNELCANANTGIGGPVPAQAMDIEKNPPECLSEGNPINVATGNKYQIESDTVLKSKSNEH